MYVCFKGKINGRRDNMNENNPYILVLGASIVDIIGFSKREFKAKDSIPGSIKISLGRQIRSFHRSHEAGQRRPHGRFYEKRSEPVKGKLKRKRPAR